MDTKTIKKLGKLVRSIPKGNSKAADEIYMILWKVMYSVAGEYLRQKADIEDAIQTSLVKIVENAESFKKDTNAYSWITRIVANTAKDMLRHNSHETQFEYEQEEPSYEIDEKSVYVGEALDVLSEEERELIRCTYWADFSLQDIADTTGQPRSTVQYHLDKALEKLKDFYNK